MKTNTPHPKQKVFIPPQIWRKKRMTAILICIFTIAAILLFVVLAFDIPTRVRFAAVNNEITKIAKQFMEPAGASPQGGVGDLKLVQAQGNGIIDKIACGFDTACPVVDGNWVVPIEPGKEQDFATRIVRQLGYKISDFPPPACGTGMYLSCWAKGEKGGIHLDVEILSADTTHYRIPDRDVSPKIWRDVNVTVDYY